jgi:hypothetical protein
MLGGACGGNTKKEVASPTSAPPATPFAQPTIIDRVLTSTAKGYEVTFPTNWQPRPNFFQSAGASTDAFFGGDEVNGAQPNISVTCSTPVLSLDASLAQTLQTLKALRQASPTPVALQVGGKDARLLQYAIAKQDSPLEQEDVIFVDDRCVWKVSLVVPQGALGRFEPDFQDFLRSFKLIPRPSS